MTTKIYDPNRCCPVNYETHEKKRVWFGRHIGIVLKYGSNGGNFTRNFKSNPVWKKLFRRGRDYLELPSMLSRGGQKALWLTDRGLTFALQQVLTERVNKDDMEGAKEVSNFVAWLLKETPMRDNLGKPLKKRLLVPAIVEEVLGAGLCVRYNRYGIVEFVFNDEDDRVHVLPADDLDKGWEKKLRRSLGWG